MHVFGLLLGLTSFLTIGLFHPVVIFCEYHFSYRVWPVFLAAGLALSLLSLRTADLLLSSALAVVAFSCFWSIVELFQQKKRVERGWFPANPKHCRDRCPAAVPEKEEPAQPST